MICIECHGSGACDPCDGYGTRPDSFPNAGDGDECGMCTGDGLCAACDGTGETDDDTAEIGDDETDDSDTDCDDVRVST